MCHKMFWHLTIIFVNNQTYSLYTSAIENHIVYISIPFIFQFLVVELNTFYLKWVLWLRPDHWLCLSRLFLWLFWGAAGMREFFRFADDPYVDVDLI